MMLKLLTKLFSHYKTSTDKKDWYSCTSINTALKKTKTWSLFN